MKKIKMKFREYIKIAKFGDIIISAAPDLWEFVLYVNLNLDDKGEVKSTSYLSSIWVEEQDGKLKARACRANTMNNRDLEITIVRKVGQIIIPNEKMSLFKRLVDKDIRTLHRAGYIDSSLELTQEGKEELTAIVFEANKAEMLVSAQKENEKSEKEEA